MLRFLLLVLLSAAAAVAQPPVSSFPWWNMPLVHDLNLTNEQNEQMQNVVREFRPKLIDLRAAVEKAEGELEDAFNEDRVDQRRATEASERVIAARADLTRAVSQMSLRLRTVLSADQWRELQKRRREGQRGPHGEPGGPQLRQRGGPWQREGGPRRPGAPAPAPPQP